MPDPTELPQLSTSVDAVMLIIRLSARYGPLMFRHDDAEDLMQPRCRPVGALAVSDHDIKLGEVAGCEYWITPEVLDALGSGGLLLDVQEAHGDASGLADRFVLRRINH